MNILVVLIPASLLLGLVGLAGFAWMLLHDQFDDPEGHAARVLTGRYDEQPPGEASMSDVGEPSGGITT